jgi:O-antigen ligase
MVAAALRRVKSPGVGALVTLAVAAVVFWVAFDGGSYSLSSRATLSIAIWWTILMAIVLGLWPLARPPRAALLAGGLLAGLAAITAASIGWAASAERAFTEANRVTLLLGAFAVAVLAGTRGNVRRFADGLALGLAAVGVLALAGRLFGDVLPAGQVPDFLPSALTRLSWPVEYWNGLAILVALSLPLLLRIATSAEAVAVRALAVGVFPALVATMYLTSSRGGFATGIVGVTAFWIMAPRRVAIACALAFAVAGSAASVAVLLAREALVNDPFAPAAIGQGRSAALLILLACAGTGGAYGLGVRTLAGRVRVPPLAGRIAAAALVAAALAAVVPAHPVERFETFRTLPGELTAHDGDLVRAHLLSGSGSGRWQFWTAALDEWKTRPVQGRGAGSYEAWWAEHGSFAYFVRDAHSLYLETLGELGLLGFAVLAGALGVGVVAGVRRLRASEGDERVLVAALAASYVGYLTAAGIDWVWELTAVSVVGMVLLGLLTGPATAPAGKPEPAADKHARRGRRRFATGVVALLAAWLVIFAQAVPYLVHVKIAASQSAVRAGNAAAALGHAEDARRLEPWAASPYLQLALVREAIGDLPAAEASIREATDRDPLDWRLWLVRARIETTSGDIAEARRSLARAAALNPRSPLFANVR